MCRCVGARHPLNPGTLAHAGPGTLEILFLHLEEVHNNLLLIQDLIAMFQPNISSSNLRPLVLLLELLTVIPEEFSTLLLASQRRAQVGYISYRCQEGFSLWATSGSFILGK